MTYKTLFAVVAFALIGPSALAQSDMKIGYANVDYILSRMPETRQMESELNAFNAQLQQQLQTVAAEYQQKLQDYQRDAATMSDSQKTEKETELVGLEQQAQKIQQDAQRSAQQKSQELRQPIFQKLGVAIDAVARENSFSHVLSRQINGVSIVLYSTPEYDVSDLVLAKLGVAAPES